MAKQRVWSSVGWEFVAAAAVAVFVAGCGHSAECESDFNCPASFACVNGSCLGISPDFPRVQVPDDLGPSPQQDFAVPCGGGGCPQGTKQCGILQGNCPRCIPNDFCCTNSDCPAAGQVCGSDGQCACPAGQTACGEACIPSAANACCTDIQCPSQVCGASHLCVDPTCQDGVANGNETDLDCGGGFCDLCQVGRGCVKDADCASNACLAGACAEPGFSRRSYGGGGQPRFVATADFNGDGHVDAATANDGDSVSVLLGRGDGHLRALGSTGAGRGPVMLAAADLDGDHRPDLVVVNQRGDSVSVLLGNGDGSFGAAVDHQVGGEPSWVAIGDVSNDGRLDLVVANAASRSISVLTGHGDGRFDDHRDFAVERDPEGLLLIDVDGKDGMDVAVACRESSALDVLLNRSRVGKLDLAPPTSLPSAINPIGIVAADLNGDGNADLVVGGDHSGGEVWFGGGNGAFGLAGRLQPISTMSSLVAADLDGDGVVDLATSDGELRGAGNGAFGVLAPWGSYGQLAALAVADFDEDGVLDVVFPDSSHNTVTVLLGRKGAHRYGTTTDVSLLAPAGLAVADLDGDGRDDVLVADQAGGALWVMLAGNGGVLREPAVYPVGDGAYTIVTADFDGDGIRDVIVGHGGRGAPTLLLGSGSGLLVPTRQHITLGAATLLGTGDLDGDGRADLVADDTHTTSVVLGRGDGSFGAVLPVILGGGLVSIQVVDFDGDGHADLVGGATGSQCGTVALNFGIDGFGNFLGFAPFVKGAPGHHMVGALVVDANQDGAPDLIEADSAGGLLVAIYNGSPDRKVLSFAAPASFPLGPSLPAGVVAANLDHDPQGMADVATVNADGTVSVVLGTGKGTFDRLVLYQVGRDPRRIATGDVNGDGKADLVTSDRSSHTITVLVQQ